MRVHLGHDIKRKNKRLHPIVRRADDDCDIVPLAEVIDVRRGCGSEILADIVNDRLILVRL